MSNQITYNDSTETLLKKILTVLGNGSGGGSGSNVLTTPGDMLYRGASTTERLPIGNDNEVLSVSGGLPIWRAEASYIDAVINDPTELPLTIGTPAINSVYLSLGASGVWLINRKPAGLYTRVADTGADTDWVYMGAFPEVNSASNWELYDGTDPTKELKFDLTSIQSGNTRTISIPDLSGTMALTGVSQNVSFGSLTGNNGTLTASEPVLDLSQTWNDSGTAFTAIKVDITNTTSNLAGSKILDISVSGVSNLNIYRSSNSAFQAPVFEFGGTGVNSRMRVRTAAGIGVNFDQIVGVGGSLQFGVGTGVGAGDVILSRDAADTLALVRGTNAQALNIYNTTSSGNANYERGFLRWSSNILQIGTERAGTGSARNLEFVGPNNARILLSASGNGTVLMGGGNTTEASMQITRDRMILDEDTPLEWSGDGFRVDQGISTTGTAIRKDGSSSLAVRNGTNAQTFRIYNTWTNATTFDRVNFRWASDEFIIDAEAGSAGGTLRGIKIGSTTSSLLGFYGVTPVDQPATVADPAGGGTIDTEARTAINAIIDRLQELGLIA